ncbi:MAG: hypothetical protein R3E96_15385 [Planctomycetota bacterium]
MSAPIQVSAFTGNKKWVDVGGDRFLGSNAYYCVVEREYNPGIDHDIHAQLMNTSGALRVRASWWTTRPAPSDKYPSISNGNDAHTWTVAWNREFNASDWDIRGAQISWGGAIATPSQSVDFSGFNDLMPKVSTPLDQVAGAELNLFVYHRNVGTHWEVMGLVMRGTDIVAAENLSQTWSPLTRWMRSIPRWIPMASKHWAVTYIHRFTSSGSDFDIRVASVYLTGSTIDVAEGPLTLAASSTIESRVRNAARAARVARTATSWAPSGRTSSRARSKVTSKGLRTRCSMVLGQISFPSALQTSNSSGQPAWMMGNGLSDRPG